MARLPVTALGCVLARVGNAARDRLRVAFHQGSAEATWFADAEFDAVVSRQLLWSLTDPVGGRRGRGRDGRTAEDPRADEGTWATACLSRRPPPTSRCCPAWPAAPGIRGDTIVGRWSGRGTCWRHRCGLPSGCSRRPGMLPGSTRRSRSPTRQWSIPGLRAWRRHRSRCSGGWAARPGSTAPGLGRPTKRRWTRRSSGSAALTPRRPVTTRTGRVTRATSRRR